VFEPGVQPGAAWLDIVRRPTLQAFSVAFSPHPVLETLVATSAFDGISAIYEFFSLTRNMYERIAFVDEMRSAARVCLEWEGIFQGKEISGATILRFDAAGGIERIRLYHFPDSQRIAFSMELARQRSASGVSPRP
jgi:hypothetical protein